MLPARLERGRSTSLAESMAATTDVLTITLNPAIDRTLVIGDFKLGAVNRVGSESTQAGGKGVNVAAALAGYGQQVSAAGFLGADNEAAFREFFAAKGIEDLFIRLPGVTRVGIKIIDPILRQTTDINFPGLAPSAADLAEMQRKISRCDAQWGVLAGSLPPGVAPGFYGEIIVALKGRGVRVALDTSGEALRQSIASAPTVIKPNAQELEALVGRSLPTETEVIAAARTLLSGGIELVAVSRGADGACFVTADEVVVARPRQIEVGSTVGAGDALLAGIIAGYLEKLPLVECARLATAFAVHALTRTEHGANARASIAALASRVALS